MEHNSAIRTYMAIMAERDAAVRERNMALDERRRAFAERDMAMLQRDAAISERNTAVQERDKALRALQMGEEDNYIIYENEMPQNYNVHQESGGGGASSNKETAKNHQRMGQEGKVGSSKVWGNEALNMI